METADVRPKAGGNCSMIRLGQVSGSTVQRGKEKPHFILREVRAGLNET